MYEYKATLARVVDGDTVILDIDLGFNVTVRETFRMLGYDSPERFTEEGKAATSALKHLLIDTDLVVKTRKSNDKDKYGRWLAEVFNQATGISINETMVSLGYVK